MLSVSLASQALGGSVSYLLLNSCFSFTSLPPGLAREVHGRGDRSRIQVRPFLLAPAAPPSSSPTAVSASNLPTVPAVRPWRPVRLLRVKRHPSTACSATHLHTQCLCGSHPRQAESSAIASSSRSISRKRVSICSYVAIVHRR